MGNSPRSRTRHSNGSGKGLLGGSRDLDSRRSTRTSPRTSLASPAKPLSPPASAWSDIEADPRSVQTDSLNALEDIAPEIVVWTEDMDTMMVDSPEPVVPPAEEEKITYDHIPFSCFLPTTLLLISRHASTPCRSRLPLSSALHAVAPSSFVMAGMLTAAQNARRSVSAVAPTTTHNAAEPDTIWNSHKRAFVVILIIIPIRPVRPLIHPALRVEQGYYPC